MDLNDLFLYSYSPVDPLELGVHLVDVHIQVGWVNHKNKVVAVNLEFLIIATSMY